MGSRLFLLRRRLRKGSRFLRGARVYRRAATAAFAAAVSVSRGQGLSGRCGTSRLPVGVQHAAAFATYAAEPALPLFFAALRRGTQSQSTGTHARSPALFAITHRAAPHSSHLQVCGNARCKVPAFGGPHSET